MPCPYNVGIRAVPSVLNSFAQQRFYCFEQRLRFQHHTFAAAERAVVHGAMAVVRVCAQIVHAYVYQLRFTRAPHDSVVKWAAEKVRENGHDVKLHGWNSVPQQNSAAIQIPQSIGKRNVDALALYVDSHAKLGGQRHQHLAVARFYFQQWNAPGKFNIANRTQPRRCAHFPHFAPDQVADVIISGIELRALLERYLHFTTAQELGGFHIFNARKMKDGLASAARRKPAPLNLHAARGAAAIRKPHFAQVRQPFREISQDFSSNLAAETAWAQNSCQGNAGESFCGHSIRGFRV